MSCKQKQTHNLLARVMALMLALAVILPNGAFAAETSSSGAEAPYTTLTTGFNADGTICIKGYSGARNNRYTKISIPAQINGTKVTKIDIAAFKRSAYLQEIYIPDTIQEIGSSAFSDCIALKEITIPGSVAVVNTLAFKGCTSLERVYILYGVQTIGDGAFSGCSNLSTVAIAPSAENLPGEKLFENADGVIVEANPDSAAANYNGVRSTALPDNSPAAYDYVVDPDTGEIIIEGYFGSSKTPVIPDIINGNTVTEIGEGAFEDKPITQVTLPETLKTIGANAFAGTNLKVVDIPSNVTGIGAGAFDDSSSITLKGDSEGLNKYLQDSKYIAFEPWGPGRTRYHQLTVKSEPSLAGVILKGRTQEYKQDSVIDIEAVPKKDNGNQGSYRFAGWTISTQVTVEGKEDEIKYLIEAPNFSKTTLKMPSYDITLTANYELVPPEPLIIRKIGEDGVVLLYTGEPNKTHLVIPTTYTYNNETFGVNKIGDSGRYNGVVFRDTRMNELTIPETIVNILPGVFQNASGLEQIHVANNNTFYMDQDGVLFNKGQTELLAYPANKAGDSYTVPPTVKKIASYAFYGNRNLKSVNLGQVEEIDDYAFAHSAQLSSVHIPGSVKSLGSNAFYYCRSLTDVTWDAASQITTIPYYAFANCGLSEISLPNGATSINGYAFAYCQNLSVINVSKTITSLSSDAFYGCNKLEAINVEDGNPNYASEDGVLFNSGMTTLMTYPIAKTEQDGAYTVPASVDTIASGAFGYAKFANIDLANVKTIESSAFSKSSVETVDLSGVTKIGAAAFSGCTKLQEIAWPQAITAVSTSVFSGCTGLTKVTLPDTVKTIGNYAFQSCSKLEEAALPSGLVSIGVSAFYSCPALKEVTFPDTLTTIGSHAFYSCRSLGEIQITSKVTSLGEYAFAGCNGIQTLSVDTNIGDYAFSSCSSLTNLTLGDNVKNIGASAFTSCAKLETVETGANIGQNAFSGCSALSTVNLRDTVTRIGAYAFQNCNALKEIAVPKSVTSIGVRAFNLCGGLTSITVDAENPSYANAKDEQGNADGVLYNKGLTQLITYPQDKDGAAYATPDTVTDVANYAFESVNNLAEVSFGENVKNLGYALFNGSASISRFTVKNRETVFARDTNYTATTIFSGISNSRLTSFVVYGYLGSTAENEVFAHKIKGVKFMTLDGASAGLVIQKIAKNANQRTVDNQPLDANTWFGKIVAYKVPEASMDNDSGKQILVPSLITSETKDIIIQDESGNEITLPAGDSIIVSTIGSHAFWYPGATTTDTNDKLHSYVKTITSITLPQTITEIEQSAFEDCTALNAFSIPVSVQKIHPYAFQNCSALTKITIPENVEMLGADQMFDELSDNEVYTSTFYGCVNLNEIKVAKGNGRYADIDGVLTNHAKNKIYEVPNGYRGNVSGSIGVYNVPESIQTIGSSAFFGCTLKEVHFSKGVEHIGIGAFRGVLTESGAVVTFDEYSEAELDIDNEAFADCTGITEVVFPTYLLRVGDDAFRGCSSLQNFGLHETVAPKSPYFRVVDGILYGFTLSGDGIDNYALYRYPSGRTDTEYVILNAEDNKNVPVRQIYNNAFASNTTIEKIVLSDDVQLIEDSAFRNCTNLKEVVWGKRIQEIGGMAFANTGLKDISLPASIAKIGREAFSGCGLTSAEIYRANATIEQDAFKGHADSFVLRGYPDSTASQYAADNSLTFAPLEGEVPNQHTVTIAPDITNGTVTVDYEKALEGQLITVTVTPDEGYQLVENSLKYNDTWIFAGNLTFEMPAGDVVIHAAFEPVPDSAPASVPSTTSYEPEVEEPGQSGGDSGSAAGSESAGTETPAQSDPGSDKSEPSSDF